MDIREIRHARRWAQRVVVALIGAVLVTPPLVLAPATAAAPAPDGPLDPLLVEPTDPLPDPCGAVPLPTCDTTPPVTSLTQKPPVVTGNKTKEKAATFGFKAFEPDENGTATTTETENATFECQLVGPGQTAGFAACTTPKAYQNLADGQYTFSVRALDDAATPNTDETPETFTWTVDTTAPQTSITSGPGTWVLAGKATFGLGSTEPGSTFRCTLDDSGRICGSSGGTVRFAPGTHTFAAFARDAVGNDDVTAATRTFTMPLNNSDLRHSKGWKQGKGSGHFLSTFSSTTKKGASLSTSSPAIKQVALVVTKGKGYGVVKVYLGNKLLRKVSLSAKRTKKAKLVKIASLPAVTSGKVKVVVVSRNKKVVIEGLGIASR